MSRAALLQAVRVARRNDATLHVFHGIPRLVVHDLAIALDRSFDEIATATCEEARERAAVEISKLGAPDDLQIEVVVGKPIEDLLALAKRVHAELIILGIQGESEKGVGAGTFATKCVRKARTDVLLVDHRMDDGFRHVVACVDFSETSQRALSNAARIARAEACDLDVVHVFQGPWNRLHYRSPTLEATPAFQREYVDRLHGLLAGFVAKATEDVPTKTELIEYPSYGRAIIDYVQRVDADLVVIGTEGQTSLRYMFVGSTVERVLRETSCSVLAVKPSKYLAHEQQPASA